MTAVSHAPPLARVFCLAPASSPARVPPRRSPAPPSLDFRALDGQWGMSNEFVNFLNTSIGAAVAAAIAVAVRCCTL